MEDYHHAQDNVVDAHIRELKEKAHQLIER